MVIYSAKKWHPTGSPSDVAPAGLIEVLRAENAALKSKAAEMEKECMCHQVCMLIVY